MDFVSFQSLCSEEVFCGCEKDGSLRGGIGAKNVLTAGVMTGYGFEKWVAGEYGGGRNGFGRKGIAVIGIGDRGKDCWSEDDDGDDEECRW